MSAIPENIILIWTGTNAAIPEGWVRETTLDSKYPKAWGTDNPNVAGGTATHSHVSPAHSHTMASHNHSGATTELYGRDSDNDGPHTGAAAHHHHDFNITGLSGGTLSDAITYQATASDPPYYAVIFIKAQNGAILKTGIVAYWDRTTEPENWNFCDGTDSTPDLRNKYLKGAATGANAGATGGTLNHSHTVDHTHSAKTHTHSGTSGPQSATQNYNADEHSTDVGEHSHTIVLNANAGETGSAYSGTAGSAETVEPAYKKINAIQMAAGGIRWQGMIGLWLGTTATVPVGWKLCNGDLWDDGVTRTPDLRDKFIKICNTMSEVGDTGGANTHTHAATNSHTHTAAGTHTHTGSAVGLAGSGGGAGGGGVKDHSHDLASVSSNTSTWGNATFQANSSDNQPAFLTAAYIQFTYEYILGGML